MGAAVSIVESSVVETGFEAYGQISDDVRKSTKHLLMYRLIMESILGLQIK